MRPLACIRPCACFLQDRREKESFFNWFYLAINVGSFIACTVIVFIQVTG